jgi:hypothetical protein
VPVAEGETIVRTRGSIVIMTDQAAAAQEDQIGAVGFCLASDQAVAVGVGSVPTPYTDQDSELWFVHQYFANRTFVNSASIHDNRSITYDFDSKAMRKMESGQTMVIVVENGGTQGLVYKLSFAVLFKVA